MDKRSQFLNLIKSNIEKFGCHITIVGSEVEPRFAYSIGLNKRLGFELIFAGGVYYLKNELLLIFNNIVERLSSENILDTKITIDGLGSFSFSIVDPSWSKLMLLGVFDFYQINNIKAFQIVPDSNHFTLDIPDMTREFKVSSEPVWKWLVSDWNYTAPKNSTVVTNIEALMGETITEVMRWENDEWEMFAGAGPEIDKKDIRVVSLGTILGIDKTLLPSINLEVDKGFWRDERDSEWVPWG